MWIAVVIGVVILVIVLVARGGGGAKLLPPWTEEDERDLNRLKDIPPHQRTPQQQARLDELWRKID